MGGGCGAGLVAMLFLLLAQGRNSAVKSVAEGDLPGEGFA